MATNLEKLRGLLQELFQLDQADLDFGIYRIMNQKRDEVVRFLDKDLLPQVQSAFKHYKSADKSVLQGEHDKLVADITNAGMNPDESPKVKELRQQLSESAVDVTALENEVFSHLFNFFRRYYSEGDFISLRRYKEGVYAIPYEGEEVKLHWANADQYYVKSSETFHDYTFMIAGGKRVRVHLVAASTEQDNNKAAQGKERRFVLAENPLSEEKGELFIRFEYRPHDGKQKQDDLNKQAIDAVLKTPGFEQWAQELGKLAPTDKRRDRTVLEKHLFQYTARNTFDYFIHKDLGGFLRRELDFYIKNEVMHLDDIEHESVPKVEQYLSQIKVIRSIAHKIVLFLEQLENFQKKLWLKKKFVIETNYCITLDRVPEELYPEIAKNDAQREEWVRLFAIDEIKGDLVTTGYSQPLTTEFLRGQTNLVLDTKFFPSTFVTRLVSTLDGLHDSMTGLIVHADNYQALRFLAPAFNKQIRCIYIDPPYNTGGDGFMYKDSYRHSSWISMITDRITEAATLMEDKGLLFSSIDLAERQNLTSVLTSIFGEHNQVEELIWVQNSNKNQSPTYSTVHEYIPVFTKDIGSVKSDYRMLREPKPGLSEIQELVQSIEQDYPSIAQVESALRAVYRKHKQELKELENQGLPVDDEWKGLYSYSHAEYRDANGRYVLEKDAKRLDAKIWIWREDNPSMPLVKEDSQKPEFRDPSSPTFRFYKPIHPVTGKPSPHPKTGWRWPQYRHGNQTHCFVELAEDNRIAWGESEEKIPQTKRFLHEVETNVSKSVISDFTDGEKQLANLFGQSRAFSNPKPTTLIQRFCRQADTAKRWCLDFFAGSGTTGDAVISLNRDDNGNRKFMLVEAGEHCRTILVPRIKKVIYSGSWTDGSPRLRSQLMSSLVKYIRLESYEDALNNLELKRSEQQGTFLDADAEMREQYTLSYMLDVESRGSQSLLNVEAFRNPDEYKLRVERNGETQLVNVDLVETFNWLLGLTVKHIDVIRGVRVVEGTAPNGDRVLVLWRNIDEMDNDALDKWFEKQDYNTREMIYDVFYVNGDNNLENLRLPDQTWKVRLIEEEFQRLMFNMEDV